MAAPRKRSAARSPRRKSTARSTAGRRKASRPAAARSTASRARASGSRGRSNASARRGRASESRTDAVSVLRRQHDATRKAFQDLAEADAEQRRELFTKLADMIAAHDRVEEELVYPEIAREEELSELALEAAEEHLIGKRLLSDLLERQLDAAVFDAKCRVLEVEVLRHIEEEEAVLLPRAQRALGKERLAELGPRIEERFRELMGAEPRQQVSQETEGAPALM